MSIKPLNEQLGNDLKEALRSKDKVRLDTIRAILTALKTERSSPGQNGEITPIQEISVLQRLKKQRVESLDIFKKQDRNDLANIEKEQLEVISSYLPPMLEGDKLEKLLKNFIIKLGANNQNDFGRLMAHSIKSLAGKAEGKTIAQTLKKLLNH
tara:strand:- start:5857 stop:6318 length:462 start_codon:yes stop_codon:yes gene_type:complete